MPTIRPDGEGDLVVMSLAAYERDQARLELYRLLDESDADAAAGDRGVTLGRLRQLIAPWLHRAATGHPPARRAGCGRTARPRDRCGAECP